VAWSGGDLISSVSPRNSCEAREGGRDTLCVGNGVSEAVRVAACSVFDAQNRAQLSSQSRDRSGFRRRDPVCSELSPSESGVAVTYTLRFLYFHLFLAPVGDREGLSQEPESALGAQGGVQRL
jgi:hypothetical protein